MKATEQVDRVSQSTLAGRIVRWRTSCRNRGRRKESSIHIRNHRDPRRFRRVIAITASGPKWGQSEVPNRTAKIWRVSGGCSLKAHGQKMFKGQRTGSRRERSSRHNWAPVRRSARRQAPRESKPSQPSAIAPAIRPDTAPTRTTHGDHSSKCKGYQAPSDGEETQIGQNPGYGEGVESTGSLPPQSVTSGDHEREGNELGAGADDESDSGWTTTAFASAGLLLRRVSSSSDVFGPFKSVAGGFCFILGNCGVRPLPVCYPQHSPVPQHTKANMYQGHFFSITTATRLPTTIPRCLWPRIQHPEKLFRVLSALAKRKHGSLS